MKNFMKAKRFPVHCAWPMGFSPSATIAQGIADRCMDPVNLGEVARVRAGELAPGSLPIFGIMMDDIWAIDCDAGQQAGEPPGARVVREGAAQWASVGLEEHEKKRVVQAMGEEVQGLYIDAEKHTMWASVSTSCWRRGCCWARPTRLCAA